MRRFPKGTATNLPYMQEYLLSGINIFSNYMPWFEILGFEALELIVLAYFVIGSYSLGYLLLRAAQPKVRILEENYRIGWSIIFGLFFSILWLAASIALGMQALFPVVLTITLIIALIAL